MYKKIKHKLKKLFNKKTSEEKYQEMLEELTLKKQKLKDNDDKESIQESQVLDKLIIKVEKKLKGEK
jgi:Skp family chaperone for outer membrane proteins